MARGVIEIIIMVILAIIFPPLAVLIERGCTGTLLLNVILTIIGWLPGVIHAIYIIFVTPVDHFGTSGTQQTVTTTQTV